MTPSETQYYYVATLGRENTKVFIYFTAVCTCEGPSDCVRGGYHKECIELADYFRNVDYIMHYTSVSVKNADYYMLLDIITSSSLSIFLWRPLLMYGLLFASTAYLKGDNSLLNIALVVLMPQLLHWDIRLKALQSRQQGGTLELPECSLQPVCPVGPCGQLALRFSAKFGIS